MGVWAAVIYQVAGATIPMLFGGGGPDYPDYPEIAKIDVKGSRKKLQKYAAERFAASKSAWASKFPLLDKGQKHYLQDIQRNQSGQLSSNVLSTLSKAGLSAPGGDAGVGNQYALSKQLGLAPGVLPQRTTQSVFRQIAAHPELTNKISGGTLASMIANNYQNQEAFRGFIGAQQTAQYVAGQAQSSYGTAALLTGLGAAAQGGMQIYSNRQPFSYGSYLQGAQEVTDVDSPGYYMPPAPTQPFETGYGNSWMMPPPSTPFYQWGTG